MSEYFEAISTEILEISVHRESDGVLVIFTPHGSDIRCEVPLPGATQREIAYAGGTLLSVMEPDKEDIRIILFPVT
jgi:hypothetical protein